MAVPYTFATATSSIPLSQLDSNFATGITLGNTTVYLGNTTTSFGNVTLTNATISSVATTFPNSFLANSSVTLGTTNVSLGGTATTLANLTLSNVTISGGTSTATQNLANVTGTLAVANGGTGLTTLTSGYIPYGNGTSAFSSSSALQFSGSNLTVNGTYAINQSNLIEINNGQSGATKFATGLSLTSDSGGNYTSGFYIVSGSNTPYNLMTGSPTTVSWYSANSEKMRLTSTGLGIGTSSPSYPLDVTGVARVLSNNQSDGILINGNDNNNVKIRMANSGSGGQEWQMQIGQQSANNFNYVLRCNTTSTNVLFADSSGNLGLGVTPSAWSGYRGFQIGGTTSLWSSTSGNASSFYTNNGYFNGANRIYLTTGYASEYIMGAGSHYWYTAPSGTAGNAISFTQAMTLDNSGNLLLNTTSTNNGAKFSVTADASSAQVLGLRDSASTYANNDNYILFSNSAGNPAGGITHPASTSLGVWGNTDLRFMYGSGATEGMRLDTSGNLLVGTTTTLNVATSGNYISGGTASYIGTGHASGTASGSSYTAYYYNATYIGGITQNGTTGVLYNTTSDQRLKTNIVDAPSGNIDQIKVRSFDFKSDNSHVEYGFIAQELVEVAPYAVHQPTNPDEMMGVDYSKLVPMMIREIQDLRARLAKAGL